MNISHFLDASLVPGLCWGLPVQNIISPTPDEGCDIPFTEERVRKGNSKPLIQSYTAGEGLRRRGNWGVFTLVSSL